MTYLVQCYKCGFYTDDHFLKEEIVEYHGFTRSPLLTYYHRCGNCGLEFPNNYKDVLRNERMVRDFQLYIRYTYLPRLL